MDQSRVSLTKTEVHLLTLAIVGGAPFLVLELKMLKGLAHLQILHKYQKMLVLTDDILKSLFKVPLDEAGALPNELTEMVLKSFRYNERYANF